MRIKTLHRSPDDPSAALAPHSESGQVSIFFSVTVILVITTLAFVVNIGLYVKARINLQNSVDAAAWGGAAVQARQLSNIAYLNWEMRNVFKEWMFKYYVLGNRNSVGVVKPEGEVVNFGMDSSNIGGLAKDIFNIPSVCMYFRNSAENLCRLYAVPGIPKLDSISVLSSVDQTTNDILNEIVDKKSASCVTRSQFNQMTLVNWIYGVQSDAEKSLARISPLVGSSAGAWPRAFELAIRIRNLELIMNQAPSEGVCSNPGAAAGPCSAISQVVTGDAQAVQSERISKAYYSAYRNLGNEYDSEMKESLVITELAPTEFTSADPQSLSNLLINDPNLRAKRYVDLKLMMINYMTFYTLFAATDNASAVGDQVISTAGACVASKVGIPAPAYPLGFVKNPDVLTYYAVKGEANFIGLFSPFQFEQGHKLTAHAAAKPFGGRIGPYLFNVSGKDAKRIQPRTTASRRKSVDYATNVVFTKALYSDKSVCYSQGQNCQPTGDKIEYAPGIPIPFTPKLWGPEGEDVFNIAGVPDSGEPKFVIPNIKYDYPGNAPIYAPAGDERITILTPTANLGGQGANGAVGNGLYNRAIFDKFAANFSPDAGVDEALRRVRAPTRYEMFNYMIPRSKEVDDLTGDPHLDSYGQNIQSTPNGVKWATYAPLFGPGLHYSNPTDIANALGTFLETQKKSIDAYMDSLKGVADSMKAASPLYTSGANKIYDFNDDKKEGSCESMAGFFYYYILGEQQGDYSIKDSNNPNCARPFTLEFREYLSRRANQGMSFSFYEADYTAPEGQELVDSLFSAYSPGPEIGAQEDGIAVNPFAGLQDKMLRNFYSTKFISVKSVVEGQDSTFNEGTSSFANVAEDRTDIAPNVEDLAQSESRILNPLSAQGLDNVEF